MTTGAEYIYIPNRVLDADGVAVGASLYFYLTGTTTLEPIYADQGLTTSLANPYAVDAGEQLPQIWLDPAITYRVRIVADGDVVISDDDPWEGFSTATLFLPVGEDAVTRTIQSKLADIVDARDFGAVGGGANDTDALQDAIDFLSEYQTLNISGDYKVTGLNITDKSNIRITGGGSISLDEASSDACIFLLVGTVANLEIDHLTLVGEGNPTYSQGAIGAFTGQTISNTSFHDLTISNINVGISHNAYPTGSWDKGSCYENRLTDLVGSSSGQGYGIHMAGATNIRVYGNVIDNASRHAIYQAAGANCNNAIFGNQIINHRSSVADGSYRCAISCARSSDVTISNNKFLDGYDGAIEISHDNATDLSCSDILVIGNTFTNRQNTTPYILVGQQAPPTVAVVHGVDITGNRFTTDNTAAGGFGDEIYIANGKQINIHGNTFRRTGVTSALTQCIEAGDASFATCDSHIGDIVIEGNVATADGTVNSRFVYVSTQLCTGSSPYTIKGNTFANWTNEWEFEDTPTNVNSKFKFVVSAVHDFASIPANSGIYAGIGVPGAKATSAVVGRPEYSTITGAVVFVFYAQSINNVEIQANNTTASASDPGSQTFLLFVEDY